VLYLYCRLKIWWWYIHQAISADWRFTAEWIIKIIWWTRIFMPEYTWGKLKFYDFAEVGFHLLNNYLSVCKYLSERKQENSLLINSLLLSYLSPLPEQELAPFTCLKCSRYRLLRRRRAFPSVFLDKY